MPVVFVLGLVLLVVTLVGHAIWLFVAFLFRSFTEVDQTSRTVAPTASTKITCPSCGARCAATFQICPTCGKPFAESPRSPTVTLQSAQRQLEVLLAEEMLSREQFESARLILQKAADEQFRRASEGSNPQTTSDPSLTRRAHVETAAQPPSEKLPTLASADADIVAHIENVSHKRSTWTDWLQAFLEKKNIRWGELLAGMLIVGSSVGLVISLWSTLRNAIPYFPALCFLAVTAAIHGAGLYSLRHWRLQTTSRGLLTIALLLVPLNFLAAIALSEQRSATDPLYLTAVAIGVAAYGWITWSGARELMHFGAAWLSLAVLGSAIGQLVIGRMTSSSLSTIELNGLFALPLTTYVVALLGTSQFAARWRRLSPRRVESLYRLLGIAFFSLAVALSLLLWKSQAVLETLSRLSPCVSLAAAMIVGLAGRLLPRVGESFLPLPWGEGWGEGVGSFGVPTRTPDTTDPEARGRPTPLGSLTLTLSQRERGPLHGDIAATAVTLVGAMLMVAAVVLAWPDPERLIAVGLVNFIALSWFGFATGLAPLHFPALECLALAGLIAFHRFGQAFGGAGIADDRNLIDTILLGRSGVVVALMSLLTVGAARFVVPPSGGAFARGKDRPPERGTTKAYLAAAAGMAVLSLGIAGYAGFWPHVVQPNVDCSLTTVVFLLFGIAGMVANERLNRIEIAWAGAVVWLAVFLHALGWNAHAREWLDAVGLLPSRPIVVALLSFATWSLGCAVVGKVRNRFVTPWSAASGRAVVVALFALPWKVWGDFGPHAIYLGWIAALCLGQAHLWQSRNVFSLSQAVAFIAAALGIASFAERQDWWIARGNDVAAFLDVRHGHWQIAGLAAACLPWIVWRRIGGKYAVLARCCDWKVDRVVRPTLVMAAAVTMWFSLWPSLGFERFQQPSLWPVLHQPWIARGWDRVLLWLVGWGAVTWSLEEVSRHWFCRRSRGRLPTSAPVRFPWVAALGTLVVGVVMFVIPQFVWHGVSLTQRQELDSPRMLFGESLWWAVIAVLTASVLALFERGRWKVRILVVACWLVLWQSVTMELENVAAEQRDWIRFARLGWGWNDAFVLGWSTIFAIVLLVGGGIFGWSCRRLSEKRRSVRRLDGLAGDDIWGVVGWLCLLPVIVLGPQVLLYDATLDTLSALFFWTALLVWRARKTRSAATAFGASHAWCWIFAAIALISNDLHRKLIPSDEVSFAQFLLWSAVALGAFSYLWCRWRDYWGPLEPSCWDWRGDSKTITPWLWQQHWSWSCILLSSLLAALAILRGLPSVDPLWSVFRDNVGHTAFALVTGSSLLAARSWRERCHTLGLATLAWVPVLATWQTTIQGVAWRGDSWRAYHVWEVGWMVLAVGWSVARCVLARSTIDKPYSLRSPTPCGPVDSQDVLNRPDHKDLAYGLSDLSAASLWSDLSSIGVVLLAVREFWFHESVAWPASCVAIVAASTAALAWVNRSQWRVAASTICVVLATAMAWTRDWDGLRTRTEQQLFWWLEACVISLACTAGTWQMVEVWWQTRRGDRFDSSSGVATAHVAARVAFAVALAVVILVCLSQTWGSRLSITDLGGWLMVPTVALPFFVSWWDRFAKSTVAGICGSVWLLLWMILGSRGLELGDHWLTLVTGLIAANVAIAGTAWWGVSKWFSRRFAGERAVDNGAGTELPSLTPALSPTERGPDSAVSFNRAYLIASWRDRLTAAEQWLPNSQLLWAGVASVLVIVGVLNIDDRSLRLWSVASAALLVPGIALFARSQRRELFQRVALGLGAIWTVDFLWAWMEPQSRADFWLQRSIRALEALAVTAFVYGVGLGRVTPSGNDWRRAVQRAARDVGVLAIVALMAVLCLEAWWFDPINGAPVTGLQIVLVAATLVALAAALLAMALGFVSLSPGERVADRPGEGVEATNVSKPGDLKQREQRVLNSASTSNAYGSLTPALSQRERGPDKDAFFSPQALVYAAEVVVALLFLHCYLTMPELFRGYLQPYWPLIVMAIAFAGVGASELCHRAKLSVLTEPLQNSAALLPLIPALGFWVATSHTDYSSVLFAGGLVYVWLNLKRRSFWYVLAASLAGNVGLWSLWSEHGVELLVRPQMWLIPPAISVLAAAQWNRQRLTEAQLAATRYPAITLLYVSSAGEMFLTGIAESFWLPVVLMVLSVLGVLAGISLRVRAFLYLGASFLLLSLVSMVWHAAEAIDHTWPWWAFGIGLGLGVLTLFGLFERKRNEMLRLLGELRTWER